MSLKDKAVSGIIWTSFEKFGTYFIQLGIGIIIARILDPSDYGIIALTTIFMSVANILLDSGFGNALIQNKERNNIDYSTAFYFNLIVGIALYTIIFLSAPYLALFYNNPLLCSVTRVIALSLILNSLTISQTARLTAELKFKELSYIAITTQISTGIIGLMLAYNGAGVWALVGQNISSCFLRVIFIQYYTKWKPMPIFSTKSFKKMFSFGWKLLCSGLINAVYENIYSLVIGKIYNAKQAGYYSQGDKLAILPSTTFINVVLKVAFPILVEVQNDRDKLKASFLKFLRIPIFILYPILVLIIIYAKPIIYILLGEKWLPAASILQILSFSTFFEPLTTINLSILYAKGRTDLVLKLEFIKKTLAFIILFISIPFGLWWLCAGRAFYGLIAYSINCYYSKKILDFGFWKQTKYNFPIILKSITMGGICIITTHYINSLSLKLIIGCFIGILSYTILSHLYKDESYIDLKQIIKNKFKHINF